MHNTDTPPEYARLPEACRRYGLSRSRLYLLAGEGLVRFVKDGNTTLVDLGTVRAYLASRPAASIRPPKAAVRADGTVEGYDDAKHFDLFTMRVADLDAVYRLLHRLLHRSDCAVVRGAIGDPQRTQQVRRLLYQDNKSGDTPTLCEASRQWLAVGADGVQRPGRLPATDLLACAAEAVGRLPEAFRGVRCTVQGSGSHGIKPDILLRLWFWLNRPTTGQELRRWFHGAPADPCGRFDDEWASQRCPRTPPHHRCRAERCGGKTSTLSSLTVLQSKSDPYLLDTTGGHALVASNEPLFDTDVAFVDATHKLMAFKAALDWEASA